MRLLEMHELIQPGAAFARRVRTAALVAAAAIEWVADDYETATPAEKASRMVMTGGDLTRTVARCAAAAHQLGLSMQGPDDVTASDADIITLVSELLLGDVTPREV